MVEQDLAFDPDAGPDGEPPRPDPFPQPSGESAARLAAVVLAAGLWRYGSGTFTARNPQTGPARAPSGESSGCGSVLTELGGRAPSAARPAVCCVAGRPIAATCSRMGRKRSLQTGQDVR